MLLFGALGTGAGTVALRAWADEPPKPLPKARHQQAQADQSALPADPLPHGAVARIGTNRFRFVRDSISRIAYSSDDQILAVVGYGNHLQTVFLLWDARTGKPRHRFERKNAIQGSPDHITGLTFSPDNKRMAWSTDWPEKNVHLWDAATGKELHVFAGSQGPAAFSPDGKLLVAGDGAVRLWDTETGKEHRTLAGTMLPVAFSPDAKHLATAGKDGAVHLWDPRSGKESRALQPGRTGIDFFSDSFTFSPDSKLLAFRFGVRERFVRGSRGISYEAVVTQIWDSQSGNKLLELPEGHSTAGPRVWAPNLLVFSPDGRILYSRQLGAPTVHALDAATGTTLLVCQGFAAPQIVLSPDGKLLGSWEGRVIRFWDTATGKERPDSEGSGGTVYDLSFSGDGKFLATVGGDQTLRLWDLATSKESARLRLQSEFIRVAFARGGRTLAVAGHEIKIGSTTPQRSLVMADGLSFWDPAPLKETRVFNTQIYGQSLAVSSDGKMVAWGAENTIYLVDAATGQEISHFNDGGYRRSFDETVGRVAVTPRINALALSPDGKFVASANRDENVYVWDIATRTIRRKFPHVLTAFVFFPPKGGTLAILEAHDTLRFWDLKTGKDQGRLKGIIRASFAPDGKTFATATVDGAIDVRLVGTVQVLRTLRGHQGRITALAYSPDSKRLASAGEDTTILFWDLMEK